MKKTLLVLLIMFVPPINYVLAQEDQTLENVFAGFNLDSFEEFLQNPQSIFKQIGSEFETTTVYDFLGFSIGMVIYGIFIWHFYRFIATRELFTINIQRYISKERRIFGLVSYIAKYVFIFPLVIFVWFLVYSTFMFFLAHTLSAGTIFLVVGSLVVATRISAYYKEDLARDLAKMLPFAMLGIFLTTPTFFKIDEVANRVNEIPSFVGKVAVFMVVSMAIEAILRVTYISKKKFFKPKKEIELEEKIEEKIEEKMQEKVEEINQKIEEKVDKMEEMHEKLEEKVEEKHDELEKKLEESKDSK